MSSPPPKQLYFPPEIWDKILNILTDNEKIQCIRCNVELCKDCTNNNKFNSHNICKVCKDIVCKNTREFVYCQKCDSTIHSKTCSIGLRFTIPADNVTIFKNLCIDCIDNYRDEIRLKYGEVNVTFNVIINI